MTSPAYRIAAGQRLRAIQGRCYKYSIGWVCVSATQQTRDVDPMLF